MKSSIYISSGKIYAIAHHRGKVDNFACEQLPEGSVINGMITDPVQLAECLSAMQKDNPSLFANGALVVDGSSILVKSIIAPKLNQWQYDQLIRDDFAHSCENAEELVCGYQILGAVESGGIEILGCAAEAALVDSYLEAFRNAGIALESIHIGIQAITNYVASQSKLASETFVFNLIDGVMMLSMIFDKGKNVFIQRSRLYGEDELQLTLNMLDSLSGMVQFAGSQKLNPIADSYYVGITRDRVGLLETYSMMSDVGLHLLDLEMQTVSGELLPPDAHLACMNMLLGETSVNLVKERRNLEKRKRRMRPKKHWLTALLVFTLLLMMPVAVFYFLGREVDADMMAMEAAHNTPDREEKIAMIDGLEEETDFIAAMIREYEEVVAKEKSMVSITQALPDLIFGTYGGKVTILDFEWNRAEGSLYLRVSCNDGSEAAQYVHELRQSSMVREIDYTGYSYRNTGEYDFSIQVTLSTEEEGDRQ